jgi:AhpC/TSA family
VLQGALADIREAGATLVAMSPQTPDQSPTLAERHAIEYPVLPDAGNAVAKQDGLVFTPAEAVTDTTRKLRISPDACNGDGPTRCPPQRRPSSGPTGRSASRLPLATTVSGRTRPSPRCAPQA